MKQDQDFRYIEALKAATLTAAGIQYLSAAQCRALSMSIMQRAEHPISETALKKVYGFTSTTSGPSLATLNGLAYYCGYQDWKAFLRTYAGNEADNNDTVSQWIYDPLFTVILETPIPTLILKANGPYFSILTYNEAYEEITFTEHRNIRNLPFQEAFHINNVRGDGPTLFVEALQKAIDTKQEVHMKALHYDIPSSFPEVRALNWWEVRIIPVTYIKGVEYLVVYKDNVTDKVLNQDAIEEAISKELTMAEDLAQSNVKLKVLINDLAESHQELTDTKNELKELNKKLEELVLERTKNLRESEEKQRKLIDNSPVAIAVIKGPNHHIETANKKIIKYWGKTDAVINKPLAVALPEITDQPFIDILNKVRDTGIPYINPELCAYLDYDGVYQPRYFDMIYQPVQYAPSITDSIFIVAIDITEHVIAKQKLQQSESMLRLAVTAAKLGVWWYDPQNNLFTYNAMFASIVGWESEDNMTFEQAMSIVTEENRDRVKKVVSKAIADGSYYESYYEVRRFNDRQVISLKATGRRSLEDSGTRTIFSGVIKKIAGKKD